MTDLNQLAPTTTVTLAELQEWDAVCARMEIDKDREMVLRKKIAAAYFPDPKEGTNSAPFEHAEGWVVKLTHKLTRKVDVALLTAKTEEFTAAGVPLAKLMVPKYELSMKAYKALTEEQVKMFDSVVETKPGAPTVEIVKPKRAP